MRPETSTTRPRTAQTSHYSHVQLAKQSNGMTQWAANTVASECSTRCMFPVAPAILAWAKRVRGVCVRCQKAFLMTSVALTDPYTPMKRRSEHPRYLLFVYLLCFFVFTCPCCATGDLNNAPKNGPNESLQPRPACITIGWHDAMGCKHGGE